MNKIHGCEEETQTDINDWLKSNKDSFKIQTDEKIIAIVTQDEEPNDFENDEDI